MNSGKGMETHMRLHFLPLHSDLWPLQSWPLTTSLPTFDHYTPDLWPLYSRHLNSTLQEFDLNTSGHYTSKRWTLHSDLKPILSRHLNSTFSTYDLTTTIITFIMTTTILATGHHSFRHLPLLFWTIATSGLTTTVPVTSKCMFSLSIPGAIFTYFMFLKFWFVIVFCETLFQNFGQQHLLSFPQIAVVHAVKKLRFLWRAPDMRNVSTSV